MAKFFSTTLILITCTLASVTIQAQNKPFNISNSNTLLEKSVEDSVSMIERLAAYYFHGIMNDYRVSKGRKRVLWSEELWIVCLNHNNWMIEKNKLTHSEYGGLKFTGTDPGDRIEYVNRNTIMQWCGENCLYNYNTDGENVEEIAYNIASKSFLQWKNSEGHNENMLAMGARIQGVSFKIAHDQVWATELLCTNEFNAFDFTFHKPVSNHFQCRDYQTMKALKKD
jgi:uncharacterized protein YkwD